LPWSGLKALGKANCPPKVGEVWRIGASRCQHFRRNTDTPDEREIGMLANPRDSYSIDWSWNSHGFINMHIPERWSRIVFVDRVI